MAVDVGLLHGMPLFAWLDERERATLAEALDLLDLDEGAALFRRGDPGDALFVIVHGQVRVTTTDDQGDEIDAEDHGPGRLVGEISLLDGGPRTLDATATAPTRLLVFDRSDLVSLLAKHPEAALDLLAFVGRRLRETDLKLRARIEQRLDIDEDGDERTFGERLADKVAEFGGSWAFIIAFLTIMGIWMGLNLVMASRAFDPYPFILLNLVLSALASLQAPVIMMSQNRQAEKDRLRAALDYEVDRRAEREVAHLHRKVDQLQDELRAHLDRHGRGRRD